jgi:hypothetical protein
VEEETCLSCHQTPGSAVDIRSELGKISRHPVDLASGVHDPTENPLTAPPHVECFDCHNGHRLHGKSASAPAVAGSNVGVSGMNETGVAVEEASYQYEICFKCHADNPFNGTQEIIRQINDPNMRLQFSSMNPSFHPVIDVGKETVVPSLRSGLSTSSIIYCTDCHGSDSVSRTETSSVRGPHGSVYEHLLVARYANDDYPKPYLETNYELCYRCHDDKILLDSARSTFPLHQEHVVTRQVPCAVCHDPHGVPMVDGATPEHNAHLINFDTRFVNQGTYTVNATGGSCTVSCHSSNTPHEYQR